MIIRVVVAIVAISMSLPVAADVSFDEVRALVWSDGYTMIKMRNGDVQRLSAFDNEGSEVLITISLLEGEISSTEYLHAMDE